MNPLGTKILASAAMKASSSEGGKKTILIILLIPIIVVLLILCFLTYILSSPLGFLLDLMGINTGETKTAIEEYKNQNNTVVALPIGSIVIEGKYAKPVSGEIEIDYGNGSNGMLFNTMEGSEVLGIANNGRLISRGTDSLYGQYVIVKYQPPGETFYCLYGNLSRVDAIQDQEVKQGSIIGRSSGKLYFEIRTTENAASHVDPKKYINSQTQESSTPTPTEVPPAESGSPTPVPSS